MLMRSEGFWFSTASWLPTALPSLVGWYSATRSTFSLTGSAVNQWGNAGPATPDLVTGVAPTLVTTGIDFVQFDGTNDFLSFAATLGSLIGADNFSILCALKIRSNVDSGTGNPWDMPAIVGDFNELFGIHIFNNASPFGVVAYLWDGDSEVTTAQNVTANTLAVIQVWHDGASINLKLNQAGSVTNACGAILGTTGTMIVGANEETGADICAAIDLYDLVVTNAALSTDDRQRYYDFVQAEYT